MPADITGEIGAMRTRLKNECAERIARDILAQICHLLSKEDLQNALMEFYRVAIKALDAMEAKEKRMEERLCPIRNVAGERGSIEQTDR